MGCSSSSEADQSVTPPPVVDTAPTVVVPPPPPLNKTKSEYVNLSDLEDAMNSSGAAEDMNLMLFIDFTASNNSTGKYSFGKANLHSLRGGTNHYLDTIEAMRKLVKTDQDGNIAVYTYGSGAANKFKGCVEYHGSFSSVDDVKKWYLEHSQKESVKRDMVGPTTLKYVTDEGQRVTNITGRFQTMIVITDGDPTDMYKKTDIAEVFDASQNPMSIVVIGVGDGVYNKSDDMPEFPFYEALDKISKDDLNDVAKLCIIEDTMGVDRGTIAHAAARMGAPKYDNFQFVNLERDVLRGSEMTDEMGEKLYLKAFGETPRHYEEVKKRNVLNYKPNYSQAFVHPPPPDWVDPNASKADGISPAEVAVTVA